jgi:hypothetical protein
VVRHKFYIEVINSPSSRGAAGATNSPSSRDAAEETNSPSKIRGGRGALITDRDEDLLNDYGIQTLRFENKIVFEQPQTIVNSVLRILTEKRGEVGQRPPTPSNLRGGA